MKKTLYFYHEQWVGFANAEIKIAVYDYKVEELAAGSRVRIFLRSEETDLAEVLPLSESEVKKFMIDGLKMEYKDVQTKSHVKLKEIEDKIQQLLCLENKEEL